MGVSLKHFFAKKSLKKSEKLRKPSNLRMKSEKSEKTSRASKKGTEKKPEKRPRKGDDFEKTLGLLMLIAAITIIAFFVIRLLGRKEKEEKR